jgi:hypothetical protein
MGSFIIETIIALAAFGYGAYQFFHLRALEKAGAPIRFGSGRYDWVDRFFYDLAGSWGVGGFYTLVGLLFAFWAFRAIRAHFH